MKTSAVPAAITQLVAILQTPKIDNVDVIDGPPTDDVAMQDVIAIGWNPEADQAAELQQTFSSAGARDRNEDFVITGWIDVWSGDTVFATARDRVFELLGVIEERLRATDLNREAPTLNGTVQWAHLTGGALRQSHTNQGARVALGFTVSCHARI
ncbi:hypothetical protein [Streptomyces sp. NBC_00620]|uniref:hypothetical protein n=1 Tax=Streptomyces sp. NBC_00620 TaxID=2903666 RepID=UPI00225260F1|nr:hypothetical protein [Streptomyces sp. NBC_00620]MCX4974217.1 hypothetical protein [Streptomyces sp. NBC_00620]